MPNQKNSHAAIDASIFSLEYSLRRYFVDRFFMENVPLLPEGCRVLDVGGHRIRKRGFFDIGRYRLAVVYANLARDRLPDIQAEAACLPFKNGSFHAVVCSEMLEHVPDPRPVLQEIYRVLQPGGALLVCAPFLHRIHADPHDYGRYTGFFWCEELEKIGFQSVQVEKQGLFWCVLVEMARGFINNRLLSAKSRTNRYRRRFLSKIMSRACHAAVSKDMTSEDSPDSFNNSFTTGFGIKASRQ